VRVLRADAYLDDGAAVLQHDTDARAHAEARAYGEASKLLWIRWAYLAGC